MPCAREHARVAPLINNRSARRSRRWGALRSEIKEEPEGRRTFAEQGTPSAGAHPRLIPNMTSQVIDHTHPLWESTSIDQPLEKTP